MNRWYQLVGLVISIIVIWTSLVGADDVNQQVDRLLDMLAKEKTIDPFYLPEYDKHFKKRVLGIKVKGEIKLWNGQIQGLSRIRRDGDVVIKNETNRFLISMRLGDQNLKASSDIRAFLGKHVHKHVKGEVFIGYIHVGFTLAVENKKFKLEQFDIDRMDHVKIKIHGSILDKLIDLIADAYVEQYNDHVRAMLTKIIRPMIEKAINDDN